jgi:integrase
LAFPEAPCPTPPATSQSSSATPGKNRAFGRLNGQFHYLGAWGDPAVDYAYNALIRRWLDNGRRLPEDDSPPLACAQLADAFLRQADAHYRKNGRRTSEYHNHVVAVRPVLALYADTPAERFGPLALHACREAMVAHGLVRSSINKMVSRIRTMFRWAVSREMLPVEVVSALETVGPLLKGRTTAAESAPVTSVPAADLEPVRLAVPAPVRGLVDLQLASACRPGEACVCRGEDIDFAGPVFGGVRVWVYRPKSWKGEHLEEADRVVFLGPRAQEVLGPWLKGDPTAYLFASEAPRWVDRGRPYTTSGYRTAVVRACETLWPTGRSPRKWPLPEKVAEALTPEAAAANLKRHWHPHQLRHNALERLEAEHGLEAAQYVAGHSMPDTTRIYSAAHLAKAAEVMAKSG